MNQTLNGFGRCRKKIIIGGGFVRIDIQQAKLSFHNYECVITLVMHNATE